MGGDDTIILTLQESYQVFSMQESYQSQSMQESCQLLYASIVPSLEGGMGVIGLGGRGYSSPHGNL